MIPLLLALGLVVVEDLRTREIPNALSLAVAMGALALYPGDWFHGAQALGLMLLASAGGRAIGMGDVKLSYGLGVIAGEWWLTTLGIAFALALIPWRLGRFPFAPMLVGATLIMWRFVR